MLWGLMGLSVRILPDLPLLAVMNWDDTPRMNAIAIQGWNFALTQ